MAKTNNSPNKLLYAALATIILAVLMSVGLMVADSYRPKPQQQPQPPLRTLAPQQAQTLEPQTLKFNEQTQQQ